MVDRSEETAEEARRGQRSKKEWVKGGCWVFQNLMGKMLTGVTWQMTIILLVLIEVVINIILLLIAFKAIKDSEDHFASRLLHFVAITILAIFVLEICLKLFALGYKFFWLQKWELLDASVVLVAFTLEVIFSAINANELRGLELVIILRLWRVVRLVSVIVSFKEEFYELIDDEIDAKKKPKDAQASSPPTETDSLQAKE
ncbi:transmembrane protein 266-like isoform X2 [Actinia tenebrosa]|uniref:Voltage-gated hydrogen channel 1 n=1 Tax=Actinia tenebrosa TaxID=6105 RepID=A0A6P8J3Q7_ACTTE|nr:transmembrane protein 266-like isoform X2 [Actinia tenebrosa]XP_031572221.1 transmembrane protein 266-like isoform X2 [Actinia tenebrosa]